MLKKTVLVLDPISLGILGFSPLLLSVIGKNNSNGELKLNSNYYNSPNEPMFISEKQNDGQDK
ncbi:hypothetical protein AAFD22_07310 [Enterococcus faecium]|uniref:hypothetical protein n=1 Tax=Enterococcus faecium TaxID=1352 RepID=UPI003D25182B